MTKFIELHTIIPVYEKNSGLVSLRRKDIFVNIDNISHFEKVTIGYGNSSQDYEFYKNTKMGSNSPDIWETSTVLKHKFEQIINYQKEFLSEFKDFEFGSGVKIIFKAGMNPIYESNEPIYALNSTSDF